MKKKNPPTNPSNNPIDPYDEELSELNRPYSRDELCLHAKDRILKNTLEEMHAHAWTLIRITQEWIDFVNGERSKPKFEIWKYAYPKSKEHPNYACDLLKQLKTIMIDFGQGGCPKLRIGIYASRSTATLIELLSELCPTEHLHRASRTAESIFHWLNYHGCKTLTDEEYAKLISDLCDDFIAACRANSDKVEVYIKEHIKHPVDLHQKIDKGCKKLKTIKKTVDELKAMGEQTRYFVSGEDPHYKEVGAYKNIESFEKKVYRSLDPSHVDK